MHYKKNEPVEADTVSVSRTKPLNISHLRGAFLLLGGGYLLSFVSLICEVIYTKYFQKKITGKRRHYKKNILRHF